ncbi:MAG TPA: hypothetical protein VFZ26_06895 [Gemmatimonadales bacterium]
MTGISRGPWSRASWLWLAVVACGGRTPPAPTSPDAPTPARIIPLGEAIVLESVGPPAADTSVTFVAGERRAIVLRHGPPENIVFAELWFLPESFGPDSGRPVRVDVRPRPGVYGVDVASSLPIRSGAYLVFKYARFFSAPARARTVYGNDVIYERALAIGRLRPDSLLALLPSVRPASDMLRAPLPASGSYIVAAPQ